MIAFISRVALFAAALAIALEASGASAQSPAAAKQASPPDAAPSPPSPPPAAVATPPPPAPVPATPPAKPAPLRVTSWGGAYGKAMEVAILTPFKSSSGREVLADPYPREGAERAALTKSPAPDVVELGSLALEQACAAGELLPLDPSILQAAPNGTAAQADFLPGGITKCGVASFAWSTVFVVSTRAFKDERPQTVDDVFNIWVYPGRRALPKGPKYNLEFALLADGVPPEEVRPLLQTDEGLTRALARLDKLGDILWWDKPSEAFALMESGKAAVALGFSARAFNEIARGRSYDIIWDRQIYDVNYFAIPKTAADAEAAKRFIAFATAAPQLAAQAKTWPYGPMRSSAIALADKHAILGIDLKPYLPTSPENLDGAVRHDVVWWAANEARLTAAFDAWLAARKPPAAKPAPVTKK